MNVLSRKELASIYKIGVDTIRILTSRGEMSKYRFPQDKVQFGLKNTKEMHKTFKKILKIKGLLHENQN